MAANEVDQKKKKKGGFQGMDLSPFLFKAIMKMGYKVPTPIQRKTIPEILSGKDVVAMARTGSGKTAAFLIPMVEKLQKHEQTVGVRAILLSPTRELAMQTAKFARKLGCFTDLRVTILVGGKSMERQFEKLANNPDIVIATPGRLMHHMVEADLSLQKVQYIVFDEADRLFELGFSDQLAKILQGTPPSRQGLLFSATLPSSLVAFTRAGLQDPTFVRLDVETSISENLCLQFFYVRREERLAALLSTLRVVATKGKKTVVFVATRHHVEFFGLLLKKAGFTASVVYGSMDQVARNESVADFRKGKSQVLVVTDVAARGLDIPFLDNVINYDFPASSKLFVHRVGRTARAGQSGLAMSFVTMDDLPYAMELMLFLGRKVISKQHVIEDGPKPKEDPCEPDPHYARIGAMPALDGDIELVRRFLEQDHELMYFHKSMVAAYQLYYKTRPSASKASVRRSKEFIEECGGALKLTQSVHPALDKAADSGVQESLDYVQNLRNFRPRMDRKGAAITTTAVAGMQKNRMLSNLAMRIDDAAKAANDGEGSDDEWEQGQVPDGAVEGQKRKAEDDDEVPRGKVRLSKAARKAMKKGGDTVAMPKSSSDGRITATVTSAPEEEEQELDLAESIFERTKFRSKDFYMADAPQKSEKENQLDMEAFRMDLMPDDDADLKRAKAVRRWDPMKKKYMIVDVGADGKAVKRKNEAGRTVRGEKEKADTYVKWMQRTHMRIQKVGEMENKAFRSLRNQGEEETADFGSDGEEVDKGKHSAESQLRKKPIVPFHGEVDEKYLTHKQKRLMAKYDTESGKVVRGGKAKNEIRSANELSMQKKKMMQNKIRQNPKMRKKYGKMMKDKYMEKCRAKIAGKGAPGRSMQLVVERGGEGGGKGGKKGKGKKGGKKRR